MSSYSKKKYFQTNVSFWTIFQKKSLLYIYFPKESLPKFNSQKGRSSTVSCQEQLTLDISQSFRRIDFRRDLENVRLVSFPKSILLKY